MFSLESNEYSLSTTFNNNKKKENRPKLLSPRTTICGGDIGSVPYVCMCVRTYVRSYVHLLSSL